MTTDPTQNTAVRRYWEGQWSVLLDGGLADEERRYVLEPYIHSFAQFTRHHGKDVLEVGVDLGLRDLQWARAGARVAGVDLADQSIAQTRSRRAAEVLEWDLRGIDAERLPLTDDSFDLIYSWAPFTMRAIRTGSLPRSAACCVRRVCSSA